MTVTYSRGRGVGGVSGVLCGVSGVVVCLPCWWCVWRAVLAKRRRAVLCAPLGGPGEYLTLGRGEFTLWLFVGLSVYPLVWGRVRVGTPLIRFAVKLLACLFYNYVGT